MSTTQTTGQTRASKPVRTERDTRILEARREMNAVFKRLNIDVKKTSRGKTASDPTVTFTITGEGLETPFRRYYLNTRLEKVSERLGVNIEKRRKDKGNPNVLVDLRVA